MSCVTSFLGVYNMKTFSSVSNISHVHSIHISRISCHFDIVFTIPQIPFLIHSRSPLLSSISVVVVFPSPQVVEVKIACAVRDAKRNKNAHAHLGSVNANPVHVDANVASIVPPRTRVLVCPHTSDYDRLYRINPM